MNFDEYREYLLIAFYDICPDLIINEMNILGNIAGWSFKAKLYNREINLTLSLMDVVKGRIPQSIIDSINQINKDRKFHRHLKRIIK